MAIQFFQFINEPVCRFVDQVQYVILIKYLIIVDPDVDGNTSSAVLLNYLYNFFPEWTENIKFYFHEGKQHGLNDCIDYIIENEYKFVLCPDAGSNDIEECTCLKQNNISTIILDHHICDI